jgi:hypothetical protein
MSTTMISRWFMVAGVLFLAAPAAAAGFESQWNASWGLAPDELWHEPWTLGDEANPEEPILGSQFLTLGTSQDTENMFYIQSDPTVDTSGSFFIEAAVRFVSGSQSTPSRAPIAINFTTAPEVGNALYIRGDEVFFNSSNNTKGPSAFVDTDGAFHTYRIDVSATGDLSLLYDGSSILTGHTFTSAAHNDLVERISWGERSNFATGTSEWASFRHNALVSEPPPMDYVLTVAYQTPESTGPLIDGFDPLPETITARFTLADVQPGQTTIGLSQVRSFDLAIPGENPNRADLDNFQLTRNSSGSPQGLTWGVSSDNGGCCFGIKILNNNFTLELTGEDPDTEEEFRYFWSTSTNTFAPAPGLTGDYNADDTVNAADYVAWRNASGTPTPLPNDPLGGAIGQSQYDNWHGTYGETLPTPAASPAVPEPATVTLLAVLGFLHHGTRVCRNVVGTLRVP